MDKFYKLTIHLNNRENIYITYDIQKEIDEEIARFNKDYTSDSVDIMHFFTGSIMYWVPKTSICFIDKESIERIMP